MQITAEKPFQDVAELIGEFINGRPTNQLHAGAKKATGRMELGIGLSDSMPDDPGLQQPLYFDPAIAGAVVADGGDQIEALLESATREGLSMMEQNEAWAAIMLHRRYNRGTGKFDLIYKERGVSDAGPDLIAAQLASPGSIGYFTDIFRRPLVWSNATKLADMYTGDNPWCELMSLVTEDYSGFAALMNAGAPSNNASADVEVQDGLMSAPVMNAWVSWRLSIEETERAKSPNSRFPFNGQPIAFKQSYANWALDMLRDYTIIYGVSAAGINGMLQVNGVTSWPYQSLSVIAADGANTNKGQSMYQGIAQAIMTFLSTSKNMLRRVRVAMSPEAINQLSTYNYSNIYNPETAISILVKNFLAGEGKAGTQPDIEIFSDPLLSAGTIFNALATDYLILSAPEIAGGPDENSQSLVRYGMPLPKFMYPVFPGMQGTPYKTLMRLAGIFAPYTPAVKVYSGFGV